MILKSILISNHLQVGVVHFFEPRQLILSYRHIDKGGKKRYNVNRMGKESYYGKREVYLHVYDAYVRICF